MSFTAAITQNKVIDIAGSERMCKRLALGCAIFALLYTSGCKLHLRERFGDELRYVFWYLPLGDVHEHAELAAEAAGAQGRF